MERATAIDLLEWGRQSTRNATRTRAANTAHQNYVTERIDAFRAHPELVHLGELERIVFGYVSDPDERQPSGAAQPRAVAHDRTGEPQ
jgi:hypothetical protein